jgi:ATP-binding cassette subfamily B protein
MQRHIAVGNTPFWEVLERFAVREWRTFGLVVAGLTPVYVVATLAVLDGSSSTAAQTAVIAAGWALYRSLGELTDVQRMTGAIQVLRSTGRLAAELDDPVLPGGSGRQPAARPVLGIPAVRFEQVSFRYPGTDRLVLDRLDLEIKPGELLAVVGLNGAGKSTLIKLLTGLYRPSGGRILVDGEDLTGLDIDTWRARLSVVFQDFVRYPLSAQDNVVLGMARRPTDRAALEQAAADAGFTGILDALPDGWDTPLVRSRAGGVDLSGGQWQQVVMTRAMYAVRAGARLLVLDEPTAHLDVRAEFEVFHRLAERRRETSVVLISHRLSTVRQADRIVLLHDGRVAESGTHDELIEHGGRYAEMFAVQAERFRRGYDDRIEEGELA